MSMSNYGVYEQGAIFSENDFDPVKFILAACRIEYDIVLADNIKSSLESGEFNLETAAELCKLFEIEISNTDDIRDYSCIVNALIPEIDLEGWFENPEPVIMGINGIRIYVENDIAGEFIYDNDKCKDESVEKIYMFSVHFPLVWNMEHYTNFHTRAKIVDCIRKIASPLMKDDIDWNMRLGYLIGSVWG